MTHKSHQQTHDELQQLSRDHVALRGNLVELDARIDTLEAALRDIRDRTGHQPSGNPKWVHTIAHQALKGEIE